MSFLTKYCKFFTFLDSDWYFLGFLNNIYIKKILNSVRDFTVRGSLFVMFNKYLKLHTVSGRSEESENADAAMTQHLKLIVGS